jgi:hypothetical protein
LPFSEANTIGSMEGRLGPVGFNGHIDYVVDPCAQDFDAATRRGIFNSLAPTVSPTVSSSPSMSAVPSYIPTSTPTCTHSYGSTDTLYPDKSTQIERSNGILFDIENTSDEEIAITSLDINMRQSSTTTVGPQHVELYVRQGTWQENNSMAINDPDMWTQISPDTGFLVPPAGKFNPTLVDLMDQGKESIVIAAGGTLGVYVVQTDVDADSADLYGVYHGIDAKYPSSATKQVGATAATSNDGFLKLKVGQARSLGNNSSSQQAFNSGNTFGGVNTQGPVSFNGHIGYIVSPCDGDGEGRRNLQNSNKNNGSRQKLRGSPTNDNQQLKQDEQAQSPAQPHEAERLLDHDYIDGWYDEEPKDPADFSTSDLFWDPFRLWTSPWYIRYRGSFTMPQCFDDTRVSTYIHLIIHHGIFYGVYTQHSAHIMYVAILIY